jgi:hypothetical protein
VKNEPNHVKMGGVVRADSTPAASATPRHQYIALKQIGNTNKRGCGGRESFFSSADGVMRLFWRLQWLNAIFVSGSCRENSQIALKGFPGLLRTFFNQNN